MPKLAINLLPAEVLENEKNKHKTGLINQTSIAFLTLLITISVTIFGLRLLQKNQLKEQTQNLADITSYIGVLNQQESLLKNLKTRLDSIKTYSRQESVQAVGFQLINKLKPDTIKTSFISIDRTNNLAFSGESTSSADLKTFLDNLLNAELTEGRISKIKIENLNRSGDQKYKFDLSAKLR